MILSRTRGRLPDIPRILLRAPSYSALRRVVDRYLDRDLVSGKDFDIVHAELARNARRNDHFIGKLDFECCIGESFYNDSLKFKTLKLGRTVYGGGGIIPDVYIPIDTSYYSKSYLAAVNRGILSDFVSIYADNHRKDFERKYGAFSASQAEEKNNKTFSSFVSKFEVDDKYFNEFLEYARQNKIEFTQEELDKSGKELRNYLKGLIVRNLYGLDYYIRYDNLTDEEVNIALGSLESPDNLE